MWQGQSNVDRSILYRGFFSFWLLSAPRKNQMKAQLFSTLLKVRQRKNRYFLVISTISEEMRPPEKMPTRSAKFEVMPMTKKKKKIFA
jgi:hypothetical protein